MMVKSLVARENQHYILAHYVFLRTFGTFVYAVFYNESEKMCYITPTIQYRQKIHCQLTHPPIHKTQC